MIFLPDPLFLPPPESLFTVPKLAPPTFSRWHRVAHNRLRCAPPAASACRYNWIIALRHGGYLIADLAPIHSALRRLVFIHNFSINDRFFIFLAFVVIVI